MADSDDDDGFTNPRAAFSNASQIQNTRKRGGAGQPRDVGWDEPSNKRRSVSSSQKGQLLSSCLFSLRLNGNPAPIGSRMNSHSMSRTSVTKVEPTSFVTLKKVTCSWDPNSDDSAHAQFIDTGSTVSGFLHNKYFASGAMKTAYQVRDPSDSQKYDIWCD